MLAAGVGLALIWLLGLRLWVSRQHRAAVAAASTAPDRKLGEKAGSATRRHALQQQSSRRHSFKAGVAFRQTVSIYGAQVRTLGPLPAGSGTQTLILVLQPSGRCCLPASALCLRSHADCRCTAGPRGCCAGRGRKGW